MRIIVVGNGMVGYKFCEKLVSKAYPGQFNITVFGEETRLAYDRVHLSEFFAGKSAEDLTLASKEWYPSNNITLHLGDPVKSIDRTNKIVHSHSGLKQSYDYLIIATGSSAFLPQIEGVEKNGVFIYRTIEDLELMSGWAKGCKTGAVIGGGLLGLEAAKAMLDLGITNTHVIEFAPRLMPRQIDDRGSKILESKLKGLGLTIHTSKNTSAITGNNSITGMTFSDNTSIDVDMLVISAGIKPRDELAKACGLETGVRGGITVNEKLQTSEPSIFAIGECAVFNGMIYGLVAPGYEMAQVVVNNLVSESLKVSPAGAGLEGASFYGFDMSTKLKLIGIDVASFGDPFLDGIETKTIVLDDSMKGIYKRINLSADGKQLLGGILVGEAEQYNMLLQTCKNQLALPPNPENIILGIRGTDADTNAGVLSLPAMACICSCENISKGSICSAVEDGAETVEAIKKCTKAGTGCGGCVPMIKDLVTSTLKAQGKFVHNVYANILITAGSSCLI